jgi:hypothetical protein
VAQVGVYSPGLLALARRLIDIAKVRQGHSDPGRKTQKKETLTLRAIPLFDPIFAP